MCLPPQTNVSVFCKSAFRHLVGFSLLIFKFQNQEDSTSSNPFALSNSVTPFARVTTAYGSYQDANIPFPRTSGARFCGAGYLVYFTRPMTMHRAVSPTEPTPRSLSALSAYHTGLIAPMKIRTEAPGNLRLYSGSPTRSEKEQVSISSFYYKERVSSRAMAFDSYSLFILVLYLPACSAQLS